MELYPDELRFDSEAVRSVLEQPANGLRYTVVLDAPPLHLVGQSGSESISPVCVTVILGGVDSSSDGLCSSLRNKQVADTSGGGVPGHRTIAGTSTTGEGSCMMNVGTVTANGLSSTSPMLGDGVKEICTLADDAGPRAQFCKIKYVSFAYMLFKMYVQRS